VPARACAYLQGLGREGSFCAGLVSACRLSRSAFSMLGKVLSVCPLRLTHPSVLSFCPPPRLYPQFCPRCLSPSSVPGFSPPHVPSVRLLDVDGEIMGCAGVAEQVLRRGPRASKAAQEEAGDCGDGGRTVPITCNAAQINEVEQSQQTAHPHPLCLS
jgi:hypothetical protein